MTTPLALLLCGPSLAGKSTLARQLAGPLAASIVSADEINAGRRLPFGGEGLPESVWAETLRLELEAIDKAGRRGQSVIVDDTCCYRWLRDRLRSTCVAAGLLPVLLVLRVGTDDLEARRHAVKSTGARPVLSQERFADHVARFEWPGSDEVQLDVTGLGVQEVLDAMRPLQNAA